MLIAALPAVAELQDFDKRWDYEHPAQSEELFRSLLPGSPEGPYRGQLLTQLARAQGLQGKFDEAHKTLDQVEALLKAAEHPVVRVRFLLERGRVFNSSGQTDKAIPLFEAAWALGRKEGLDFHAVDAAHMLGIACKDDAALAWNEKALALAESTANPQARKWLGTLYNNLGWTYHDQKKDFAKALQIFQKSRDWFAQSNQPREIRIADWSIGKALRSLGRIQEALALQQAVLKAWEAAGETDGYVFEELGECLLTLGQAKEAASWFARAHAELSKDPWMLEHEKARMERLKRLSGSP